MATNPDGWRAHAACQGLEPRTFFPDPADHEGNEIAKSICAICPSRQACLEFALATKQDEGVWGGVSEIERGKLRRRWLRHRSSNAGQGSLL